ncbi:MAG: DUF6364 family protein [Parafilimonas sp.]
MLTKLTLSINEQVIKKAKLVSRNRGKSLSRIVEDYLQSLSSDTEKNSSFKKLSGVLKNKIPPDVDLKKEKGKYINKKYGL